MRRALVPLLALACDGAAPTTREPFERDPALDAIELVSAREATSHEPGSNCMSCHGPNGDGPGAFHVAATVWREGVGGAEPAAGVSVQLRTGPLGAGDLLLELITDEDGNFYTTDTSVDFFAEAVFPTVVGEGGEHVVGMPWPTGSGACNVCHGVDGAQMLFVE